MRRLIWAEAAALALVPALLASPALSQETPPPPPGGADIISGPVWLVEPPRGDMSFAFYARDYRSHVQLRCTVAGEDLIACQAIEPTPHEFLAAAATAAQAARIAPQDGDGHATEGREVAVSIAFPPMPIPVAVDPPSAPPNSLPLTGVVWQERPTGGDFARNYPPQALRDNVGGSALLDCLIAGDGRLACTVLSEEPAGRGFGTASLAVARSFRAAPQLADGTPTAGRRTRVPIRWRLE